jgi:hypothetical protein
MRAVDVEPEAARGAEVGDGFERIIGSGGGRAGAAHHRHHAAAGPLGGGERRG